MIASMSTIPFADGEEVYICACSNGKFLCADDKGQQDARPILANRDRPSDWERFTIVRNNDGTVSIRSYANGKFLSAEIDTDGRLNARADVADAWERFRIIKRESDGRYAFCSYANKYVSVISETGQVAATADVADERELFAIIPSKSAVGGVDWLGIWTAVIASMGAAACATGVTAAVAGTTVSAGTLATVGAVGSGVGATIGGIVGSGIGIALGPWGAIAGTIPCAIGGGALGGSMATTVASTCASTLGLATVPAWAVPVAVCGGVALIGAGVFGTGRYLFNWW